MKNDERITGADSTTEIPRDDARVTAYVLGERAGLSPSECAAIERLLESDSEFRAECDELVALGRQLEADLAGGAVAGLTPAQRSAVAAAIAPRARGPRRMGRTLVVGGALAASTALALFALTRAFEDRDDSIDRELARVEKSRAEIDGIDQVRRTRTEEYANALRGLGYIGDTGSTAAPNPEPPPLVLPPPAVTPFSADAEVRATSGAADPDIPGELDLGVETVFEESEVVHFDLNGLGYSGGSVAGQPSSDEFFVGMTTAAPSSPGAGGPATPGPASPGAPAVVNERLGALSAGRPATTGGIEVGASDHQERTKRRAELDRTRLRDPRTREWAEFSPPTTDTTNESYDAPPENPFVRVGDDPLSTFSIDVDTASYANVRRFLTSGQLPPADAVRIEELVNYFSYAYPQPAANEAPFSVNVEVADCPWSEGHRLMQIGLKGREFSNARENGRNLVFLVDVSGSMSPENKLPLVQRSLEMLLDHLSSSDRVAIVVYAGAAGVVLPSTQAGDRAAIRTALANLKAGGSTNGGQGIELAYSIAQANFIKGGVNRVLLATDGDFNVGVTDRSALLRLIEEKARGGVFLTVLGYGMGNLKDATMEQLADKGNGNYAYVDNLNEARKVLVVEADSTLETIAKDVKIQLEFNPATVAAWRLVGYENRVLAHRDFNDDTKDAGEIGAGHTVTAIYELVPVGMSLNLPGVDPLKYQVNDAPARLSDEAANGELLTVKLRYKEPDGRASSKLEVAVHDPRSAWARTSADFRFAAAVAGFGMLLKDSAYRGGLTLDQVRELALEGAERDPFGYRHEFLQLVERARQLGLGRVR